MMGTGYLAEFVGTALLILFGNGVVANVLLWRTKGNCAGWIVIAAGWGLRAPALVGVGLSLAGIVVLLVSARLHVRDRGPVPA
jgi:glycerol uptake facilitator-like aquaporin